MITKQLVVNNDNGIHARPSMLLSKIVQSSKSSVKFTHETVTANGNSILELLSLAAFKDSIILVEVSGEDEIDTMKNIENAFNNGFELAYKE
jgi:phosphocarrier protein HPr